MQSSEAQVVTTPARILIVEDQFEVREALSMLLADIGHRITSSSSPEEAIDRLAGEQFELILLDMNYRRDTTSGTEGLGLLSLLRTRGIDVPVIAMTAWGSVDIAVEAMHSGACDFVQKPWDNAHLLRLVTQHLSEQRRRRELKRRERLEWEDAIAVQRRLMPAALPEVEGLSMAAISKPFSFLGGDYYDVFEMGNKIAICIADVIGKGVPAALMMSNLQAAVKVIAAHDVAPSEVCSRVNELVCSNGARDKFISFFYALIDRKTKQTVYCNCGHNAPILLRARGECERLETGGTLLGLKKNELFIDGTVTLQERDRLLLFTDGISEAENETGEVFGEDRLRNLLQVDSTVKVDRALANIVNAASEFCENRFVDDVTALLVHS